MSGTNGHYTTRDMFHCEEVGSGSVTADLSVAGTTTGNMACITVDNSQGLLPMTAMVRFTTFSSRLIRIGDGAMRYVEELSLDGGTTWITLSPNIYERTGSPSGFRTDEGVLLVRASNPTIPAGEVVTFCSRINIIVDTPYDSGSGTGAGMELEVIAGTQRP